MQPKLINDKIEELKVIDGNNIRIPIINISEFSLKIDFNFNENHEAGETISKSDITWIAENAIAHYNTNEFSARPYS